MISSLKKEIRGEVLFERDRLNLKDKIDYSKTICEKLFNTEAYKNAKVVHFYISIKSEVITVDAVRNSILQGKEVIVPVMDKLHRQIRLSRLRNYDSGLSLTSHGLIEPKPEFCEYVEVKDVNLMVLPGVAFDLNGHRLGYGAGFYDRLLRDNDDRPFLIGLAFELQIVNEIPVGEHDVRMDRIITEKRIIEMKK